MFLVAAAFALALVQPSDPAPSAAGQTPALTPEEQARAAEEARLDEIVCRREHVVGTNRPQRICQTRRQWDGLRQRSQESLDRGNSRINQQDMRPGPAVSGA